MKRYVMDSYAMIAFFEDEPGAAKVAEILDTFINQKAKGFIQEAWGQSFN